MNTYNCNECKGFELKAQADSLIWRYISLDKLESLLKNQALYFASARELNDDHEGSLTDQEFKNMFDLDFTTVSEDDFKLMKKFYRHFRFGPYSAYEVLREFTKINCWHLNEHESSAMWDI